MIKQPTPLEAFETVKQWYSVEKVNTLKPYQWKQIRDLLPNECKIIETALKDYEKKSKVLEIIKEKGVFVHLLKQCRCVQEYNAYISIAFKNMPKEKCEEQFYLSQKEFDLLKEELGR